MPWFSASGTAGVNNGCAHPCREWYHLVFVDEGSIEEDAFHQCRMDPMDGFPISGAEVGAEC